MRRPRVWLIALVALVPACDPANADLADLPGLRVEMYTHQASDTEPATSEIFLVYDLSAFWATHDNACARIDDATVLRFDGARAELVDRGRNDDFDCELPRFTLDPFAVTDQEALLTIEDDSLRVSATFAPGTFTPHQPTLRSPSDWTFAAGQNVRIGWSHPSDLSAPIGAGVVFRIHDVPPWQPGESFDLVTAFVGDEIQFAIPSPPPITGPGYLFFAFEEIMTDASTCENAAACVVRLSPGFRQPVTIIP
jgi:hypothetical protein